MDERWAKALDWYEQLPMGRRKVEYTATIRRILAALQDVADLEALQARYDAGLEWATAIAREGFPDTPALWAVERTADVAFGIRAKQLQGT
jgi:predicted hydrocarbon binding protein